MISDPDPLDPMITRLRTGRELPFDWVIEHAGDGDVVAATARLYATSVRALPEFAFHAGLDTLTYARATVAALLACTTRPASSNRVRRDYTSRLRRWVAATDYAGLVENARALQDAPPDRAKINWDTIVRELFDGFLVYSERRARIEMSSLVERCLPERAVADAFRSVATPAIIAGLVRQRLVPYDADRDTLPL